MVQGRYKMCNRTGGKVSQGDIRMHITREADNVGT